MSLRTSTSNSCLALPPTVYTPKRHSFGGAFRASLRHGDMAKCQEMASSIYSNPSTPTTRGTLEDYNWSPSSKRSQYHDNLCKPKGLAELHYTKMRKASVDRTGTEFSRGPSMHRPFMATTGYSGFVPGKDTNNLHGCSFKACGDLAYELNGNKDLRPMSGVTFHTQKPGSAPGALSVVGTPASRLSSSSCPQLFRPQSVP